MKRTFLIISLIALCGVGSLRAQMPTELISVMKQCELTLDSPDGVCLEMTGEMKMQGIAMKLNVQSYSKGEKSLLTIGSSMFGMDIKTETGYDGTTAWEYSHTSGEPDTLFISHQPMEEANEFDINLDVYDDYKKGTIDLQVGIYTITLSKPKDKDMPKQTIFIIEANTYKLLSMQIEQKGQSTRLNINKITHDIPDSIFTFDREKYPSAVIIEE